MTILTRAVSRGVEQALVIGDLPFMSYQVSDAEAVRNAGRLVKEGGADAVKLEGAGPSLDRVQAIVAAGIPVMGHIGLTPQTATIKGGHKAQGRQAEAPGAVRRRARRPGGWLLRRRAGGGAAAGIGRDHRGAGSRPSASAPVPARTVRCWCCTTCSASAAPTAPSRGSSSTTPTSARRCRPRSGLRGRGADPLYPAPEHTYSMPDDELAAFRASHGLDRRERARRLVRPDLE